MKRKIRPAEEEMGNVAFLILFAILWYACLVASLVNGGTRIQDCSRCILLLP